MSLYESFLLLNMFRMLLHSSSGAGDCMWVYCSVMIDVYALASSLLVSVYLWVYWFVACYYNVSWMCSIALCKGYHVHVWVCTGVLVWNRNQYIHQFIILTYFVSLLFTFYIQGVLKLKKKIIPEPKV